MIAVIMLIGVLLTLATTAVFRHMNSVKRKSAVRSAISYVTAINDYNSITEDKTLKITSGSVNNVESKLKNSYTGTKPTSGSVIISTATSHGITRYNVTRANLVINGFTITCLSTKCTIDN